LNRIIVNCDIPRGEISKHIYGHFSEHLGRCIYEGIWVGEQSPIPNTYGLRNDVIQALKQINIPVLRWPGGCFADEYHWKDGIGPRETRKKMINSHWGGVVENNHFGTHEFLLLCELLECEPYICGNVGSGSIHEMQEWVEYMTFEGVSPMADMRRTNGREQPWKIKYFGVGNENWGCGGNMLPEYYADLYRNYQSYVRNYGDNRIYKIAGGPNVDDYNWMDVLMRKASHHLDGISLHNYVIPGGWMNKRSALEFDHSDWYETMQKTMEMDTLITRHSTIMDRYDPDKRVGLIVDEWGTWFQVEPGTNPGFLYQQNTLRDALVAGVTLNIFQDHCERVHMANLAQTVNVLQALVLTDGHRMLLTPTYHVFDMYKVHQGATRLDTYSSSLMDYEHNGHKLPQISISASKNEYGIIHISLCNMNPIVEANVQIELRGLITQEFEVTGLILTAHNIQTHNTFDHPDMIKPTTFHDYEMNKSLLQVTASPASVIVLSINY